MKTRSNLGIKIIDLYYFYKKTPNLEYILNFHFDDRTTRVVMYTNKFLNNGIKIIITYIK